MVFTPKLVLHDAASLTSCLVALKLWLIAVLLHRVSVLKGVFLLLWFDGIVDVVASDWRIRACEYLFVDVLGF